MWTHHLRTISVALGALSLFPATHSALMPRQSPALGCFVCQTDMGIFPASISTDASTGDLVCVYSTGDEEVTTCSYNQQNGASTGTDPSCPATAAPVTYICPATLPGAPLRTAAVLPPPFRVLACLYASTYGPVCGYNTANGVLKGDSALACPANAPQCVGAGPTRRRGVLRSADNFAAVMAKRRSGKRADVALGE